MDNWGRGMINHENKDISCNGGGGALGHPKVYLAEKDGKAKCSYCGKEFKATTSSVQKIVKPVKKTKA